MKFAIYLSRLKDSYKRNKAIIKRYIVSFFTEHKNVIILSSLASTVSAIIATFALIQANQNYKLNIESSRPYISIESPSVEIRNQGEYLFSIETKNIGLRSAKDFQGKVLVFSKPLEKSQVVVSSFSSANEIAPNLNPTWRQIMKLPSAKPGNLYLAIAVKYTDPITDIEYKQTFYVFWQGVGVALSHLPLNDKKEIEPFVKKLLLDF